MTPLETFTAIGAKLFTLSVILAEPMELITRTDGTYRINVLDRALSWKFADRDECLAFLEAIDGDDAAQQERIDAVKAERLQQRITEDQAALSDLA